MFLTVLCIAVGTRTECITAQVRREKEEEEAAKSDLGENSTVGSGDSGDQFSICASTLQLDT